MLNGTYIELQFSRRSITELVRTSLILNYPPFNPLLPPTGYPLPPAANGSSYTVAQTAFLAEPGAMGLRHGKASSWNFEWADMFEHAEPVPAKRCEVTQRLRLVVTRAKPAFVAGTPQEIDVGTIEGTLVVDLGAYVADNVPRVTLSTVQFVVESDDVDPALKQVLESTVPTWFADVEAPLSVRNLLGQSATGGSDATGPHVQNCGVALTADSSAFALRLQLGGAAASGLLAEWKAFHAGAFPNRLLLPDGTSRQWGVLLSPHEVEALTVQQTEEQLEKHADEFRLTSGVGATWSPQGSTPHVYGDFYGTVLVPCRPDYHVTFDGRIEVPTPNQLTTVTHVDWHGDFWDLIACEGLVALGAGTAGAAVGAGVGGPLGAGIGFGLGLAVGFIGTMVVATVYTPSMGTESCTQDGDTVTCTRDMQPAIAFAGAQLPIELVSATATDDGLLLGGTYQLPFIPALRHTILEIEVTPFDYAELPVNCGNLQFAMLLATSDLAADFTYPMAMITVRAVDEDGTSRAPAAVSVTRTSGDAAGVFPPSAFQVIPYPDRAVILVRPVVSETVNATYWTTPPYGVTLDVFTPFSRRTVTLGPVPRLTAERLAALRGEAFKKLNDCLAKQPGVITGKHKLTWLVDPPYGDARVARLWYVAALGVRPNEEVSLEDDRGLPVAMTLADGRGTARLSVRTPDGPAHQVLTLRRAAPPRTRGARQWDIRVKQIELLPQGTLAPGGAVLDVTTHAARERHLAAVRTTEALALYDLTFPATPRGVLRLDAAGIAGTALLDAGLAAWGRGGLTLWSLGGRPRRLVDTPVAGARLERGALVVETAERTLRVDRDATRAVEIPRAVGCAAPVERLVRDAVDAVEGAVGSLLGTCDDGRGIPRAPEQYTVGSALLVPTQNGRALELYAAGRWVDL